MTARLTPRASGGRRPTEWLTIRDASALAGVSPATLRRWSNAGDIRAFTTPGGHRRFARSAVLGLLPPTRVGRPPVAAFVGTTGSIIRAYRRGLCHSTAWPAPIASLPSAARQPFRECGRSMVAALVDYLDQSASDAGCQAGAERLAAAEAAAGRYGRLAAETGIALCDTVEVFLRFRSPFLSELGGLARRMALDAAATTTLLEGATDAIDRLMPALIAGHETADRSRRRSTAGTPAD